MGKRTQSMIGTENGAATVRVFSANPKTADGYNTFIFRRAVEKSLRKLSWLPVIDGRGNPLPEGIRMGDKTVAYTEEGKAAIRRFVVDVAIGQKGPLFNDDFGEISIGRDFVKEIQQHCISTRHDVAAVSSAREIASKMVHLTASPNQEVERRNGVLYFEYGLARLKLDDGLYLVMGEVGVRRNSQPYYDQRIAAKFKADSEAPSLHGHLLIGEPAFDVVYDSRFRLILQGVELYFLQAEKAETKVPLFSIIIPVYNVAPYLRECLDSVLAQTFSDWEAICVDDGSTDGSGAILDEYAAKDYRFKVVHQKNAGVSVCRNKGIALARGRYITFCDADDMFTSEWLNVANHILLKTGVDLLRMQFFVGCKSDIGKEIGLPSLDEVKIITGRHDVLLWAWHALLKGGWSPILFLRHDIFSESNVFPIGMRMKEDNIFCLKIIQHVDKVCQFDYAGYFYRQRNSSAIHQTWPISDTVRFCNELMLRFMHDENNFDNDVKMAAREQVNKYLMEDLVGYFLQHGKIYGNVKKEFFQIVVNARRNGFLRILSVPRKSRIPLFFMVVFKSTCGFAINDRLIKYYAQLRSILAVSVYYLSI